MHFVAIANFWDKSVFFSCFIFQTRTLDLSGFCFNCIVYDKDTFALPYDWSENLVSQLETMAL
jgi:hypothetical protein